MCVAPNAARQAEIADIFRRYGPDYRARVKIRPRQARPTTAIEQCRTPAMSGHLDAYDHCDAVMARYYSCRDRHCPKCQTPTKERWIEARNAELSAAPYYHLVFTLPHALSPLIQGNPRTLYNLLLKVAAETLLTFGRAPRWIGREIGITFALHTWSQSLGQHVHVRGLVIGGGLALDGNQWMSAKKCFLFPVKALSKVFRAKYLELLAHAKKQGALTFAGSTLPLLEDQKFTAFLGKLKHTDWVVFAKAPFSGPRQVVAYLGRYTNPPGT